MWPHNIYKGHEYYKREFLQTLAADTRALILVFLPHGNVKVFRTLNSRRMVKSERQSFPFDLAGELALASAPRICDRFHSGLK